jgi:hypothetical protein
VSAPHVRIGGRPGVVGPSIVRVHLGTAGGASTDLSAGRMVRVPGAVDYSGCGVDSEAEWQEVPAICQWGGAPAYEPPGIVEWLPAGNAGFVSLGVFDVVVGWKCWAAGTIAEGYGPSTAWLLRNGVRVGTEGATYPYSGGDSANPRWPVNEGWEWVYKLEWLTLYEGDVFTVELPAGPLYWADGWHHYVGQGACFTITGNQT